MVFESGINLSRYLIFGEERHVYGVKIALRCTGSTAHTGCFVDEHFAVLSSGSDLFDSPVRTYFDAAHTAVAHLHVQLRC